MSQKEKYSIWHGLYEAGGKLAYSLAVFGDHIAEREGYKVHSGMDAVIFYLADKYSWPVSQVRGMSFDDMEFILAEEMHGWTLPADARP